MTHADFPGTISARFHLRAAVAVLTLTLATVLQADQKAFEVETLADGVYGIVWVEPMVDPIEANNLIIVNDRDVVVVDSSLLPSTAKRVIDEVRKITDKPVRYVVNTHWHDDHVFGNAEWRRAWPGVEFIAHSNTRVDARDQAFGALPDSLGRLRNSVDRLEGMRKTGKGPNGEDLTTDMRRQIDEGLVLIQTFIDDLDTLPTVLPDVTFEEGLTLERGDRTIEIRHLGLGNTRGDVVVILPKERIVATGDLVVHPTPFGIGSYYSDWIETLGTLASLDVDIFFPGHGAVQHDTAYIESLQGLLRDLVSRVDDAVGRGLTLEQTQAETTLEDWKARLAGDDPTLVRAFDSYFVHPAVERAWRQAMGEADTTDRLK